MVNRLTALANTTLLFLTLFLTLSLTLFLTACSEPGSEVVDGAGIVGTYTVNGTDANDVEYSGTVVIEATDRRDVYVIQWIVTGAIQEGTARRVGDTLEVEWRGVEGLGSSASGTARYTINDDGTLVGTRTIDGADGVGTEEVFPDN